MAYFYFQDLLFAVPLIVPISIPILFRQVKVFTFVGTFLPGPLSPRAVERQVMVPRPFPVLELCVQNSYGGEFLADFGGAPPKVGLFAAAAGFIVTRYCRKVQLVQCGGNHFF